MRLNRLHHLVPKVRRSACGVTIEQGRIGALGPMPSVDLRAPRRDFLDIVVVAAGPDSARTSPR